MTLLDGKRLLLTGVLTRESIAYATAERALDLGAEVVLTSFGRAMRMTARAARTLSAEVDILELDVHDAGHHRELARELDARWGAVDGVLHAIAFGTADAYSGSFVDTQEDAALEAFRTTAWSYNALARTVAPLMARAPRGASLVGLDFDGAAAWAGYNWLAVAKASLRTINTYLCAELGPHGVRCNLIASGPLRTVSGSALPLLDKAADDWDGQAPVGWDPDDASVVADAVCLLMSDLGRGITGETIHVDGGLRAVGGHVPEDWRRRPVPLADLADPRAPA